MENKVVEVINVLCEKFGVAIDWTNDNVVPYIQELIGRFVTFEVATSIFWICFFLTLAICAFVIAICLHKKTTEDDWRYESPLAIGTVIAWASFGLLTFILLIIIPMQTMDIIECKTIPEKVILDYLTAQTTC